MTTPTNSPALLNCQSKITSSTGKDVKHLLLVLDPCSLALAPEPTGGVVIRVTAIEGLPDTTLLIPVAKEAAEALRKGMDELMQTVPTFTNADLKKATNEPTG
jgi:hypothetical protein